MSSIFEAIALSVKQKPHTSPRVTYEDLLQQSQKPQHRGDSVIIDNIEQNPIVQDLLHKQHLTDAAIAQKQLDEKQRQIDLLQQRNQKLEHRLNTVIGYTNTRHNSSDAAVSPRHGARDSQRRPSLVQQMQHYYIDTQAEQDRYKLLLKQLSVQTYVKQWKTRKSLASILAAMLSIIKQLHKYCSDLGINENLLASELRIQQSDADTFLNTVQQTERMNNNLQIEWYMNHILDSVPVITVSIEQITAHKQKIDTVVDCFADRNLQLTTEHRNAIECADETIQRYDALLKQHTQLNDTYQQLMHQHRAVQQQLQHTADNTYKLQQLCRQYKTQCDTLHSRQREQATTILQLQRRLKQQNRQTAHHEAGPEHRVRETGHTVVLLPHQRSGDQPIRHQPVPEQLHTELAAIPWPRRYVTAVQQHTG